MVYLCAVCNFSFNLFRIEEKHFWHLEISKFRVSWFPEYELFTPKKFYFLGSLGIELINKSDKRLEYRYAISEGTFNQYYESITDTYSRFISVYA